MGRLAGFKYKIVTKRLRAFGFVEYRHESGSHQVWYNQNTKQKAVVPKHTGDIPEGTMRSILKQADIEVGDFLNIK